MRFSDFRSEENMKLLRDSVELNNGEITAFLISDTGISTGIPLYVICQFLGEIYGFTDFLRDKMKRLSDFYGYGEIEE
jgi:hypothetical protein